MKLIFILIVSSCGLGWAQTEIVGDWEGVISMQGLKIAFHIQSSAGKLETTLDSPDQGAFGIAAGETRFSNGILTIAVPVASASFEGKWTEEGIIGKWRQGGMDFDLVLKKAESKTNAGNHRPQTPEKPYPYIEKEVVFKNEADDVQLAGTLSLPSEDGTFAAVILISGSGPQDRDESLMGHKPFLILADHLCRNGMAVLRYDDRGTAQSTGDFSSSNSKNFASDVEAAIQFLKTQPNINPNRIGLIGHSEGGIIAPMVAASNRDVSFIIMLAGSGIKGDELLRLQNREIFRVSGAPQGAIEEQLDFLSHVFKIINQEDEPLKREQAITQLLEKAGLPQEQAAAETKRLSSPWFKFLINYDPSSDLGQVHCPVLAMNGALDVQVPPEENLKAIEKALSNAGNVDVSIRKIDGLNHLFQTATTGSPAEYAQIEETFSPVALGIIVNWLKGRVL